MNDIHLLRESFSFAKNQLAKEGIANCIHPDHYKFKKLRRAEISAIHIKGLLEEDIKILSSQDKICLLENQLEYNETIDIYIKFLKIVKKEFLYDSIQSACDKALAEMNYNPIK